MCAFMPKYHWFPFLDCFICGSRSPLAFFTELGAEFSAWLQAREDAVEPA
jgi:hypothetical protein